MVAGTEIKGNQSLAGGHDNKHGRAYYCGRTRLLSRAGGNDLLLFLRNCLHGEVVPQASVAHLPQTGTVASAKAVKVSTG